MSLIYMPTRYAPEELISPAIFALCGPDALYLYDPDVLRGLDRLSIVFGSMIANTYHNKRLIKKYGLHRFRGLRARFQKLGAELSAHKIGIKKLEIIKRPGIVPYSAGDVWPVHMTAVEIREIIKKEQRHWVKYFKRMETHNSKGKPISWIHGDSKPHGYGGIRFFKQ